MGIQVQLVLIAIFWLGVASIEFPNPPGFSTTTYDAYASPTATAASTGYPLRSDFSNDALLALWDKVGPVTPPRHTAVADAQAEDSSFAQPDESFHPLLASNHPELAGV